MSPDVSLLSTGECLGYLLTRTSIVIERYDGVRLVRVVVYVKQRIGTTKSRTKLFEYGMAWTEHGAKKKRGVSVQWIQRT